MKATPEELRAILNPFLKAVQNPVDFNQEDLFAGREALKSVFDRIDARSNPALADGFGGAQAMLVSLIRKKKLEQNVALKGLGSLLNAILALMESGGMGGKADTKIPEYGAPAASKYLRLADGPSSIPLNLPGMPGLPAPTGGQKQAPNGTPGPLPTPAKPQGEHSLGQLLVGSGKISQGQLTRALDLQQINGRRLGEVLIAMEAIGIHSLEEALSRQQMLSDCKPSTPQQDQQNRRLRLDS